MADELKLVSQETAASPVGKGRFSGVGLIILVLLLWETAVRLTDTPAYLFPTPTAVFSYLATHFTDLLLAGGVTLLEAVGGLILGTAVGLALAVLITFWQQLEQGVMSLAILIKSTPIIAIAPILTIWLGFGPAPKVIVTALLTFFPVLINALTGFRSLDVALLDWFHSLNATPQEIFVWGRWPSARPYLFAALRVVAPLSLIGAVVAEWMGASSGLGRSMWLAYTNLNMPSLFAAVFILTGMSTAVYQIIVMLEKRLLFWQ
ncbi:Hydroxymethylpyrimidine ABC transporter, transmembrane component [hydrothermal vent metagenome]|uniref:Hydroxymethylpyrimidine ABC transporter, transmembrane component n=1 Tax=hydrothermal vent metagenome TaxID=652676 RepID=A0A3B0V3N8_9ZZZZ